MASLSSLRMGDVVSFDVYPAAVLGTSFRHVKIVGFLDMDSAKQWIDPIAMHINVYPTLPEGTPNDANSYYYVKVKMTDGQVTCLGLPWIREESIVVHDTLSVKLTIENIGSDDVEKIVRALAANGYRAVDVKVV